MVLPEHPQSLKQLPRLAFASGSISSTVDRGIATLTLTSAQRHYLERVRRLRIGDRFLAFDSSGRLWQAALADADAVIETELIPVGRELPFQLELAIAVPKGSGFDTLVRQLTELGVSRIVPLTSERTVSVPSSKKLQRWRAIATEAVEQCERVVVPIVAEPSTFRSWLHSGDSSNSVPNKINRTSNYRYIAAARDDNPYLLTRLNQQEPCATLAIAVGPEGGWTDRELEQAQVVGVLPISLGKRILRTVTAPLVIASLVMGYGDCLEQ
ncbi:MAG: 16S rRNA (uracil(1498)-N(3))-methyltransferase [Synechococcus sp.]